jgi:hypothetical protein
MDIFFKRKKIIVDCFTYSGTVYDYFPILPATKQFTKESKCPVKKFW